MIAVRWAEREWGCLPERALWWPDRQALICADVHVGKDEAFRKAGIPLPERALADDLERLSRALARVSARRLIVLGDFLHARAGRGECVMAALARWRSQHAELAITLVRGNHDRAAGDPPRRFRIEIASSLELDRIVLCHEPPRACASYAIYGHIHPVYRPPLHGERAMPCFWFRARALVLPAFSGLVGGYRIRPARRDRLALVGPEGNLLLWGSSDG